MKFDDEDEWEDIDADDENDQEKNQMVYKPLLWKTLYYHNLDATGRKTPYTFNDRDHELFKNGDHELSIFGNKIRK